MANKKVVVSCEGFKARRQEGNGYTQGEIKDILGLQEVGYEVEQGSEPVFADSMRALTLQSGLTGATVTANLMELTTEERQEILGIKVQEGMEIYTSDAIPPYVSLSWKLKCSDGSFVHYGFARGNFSVPNSSASTMEDSPEQQDQVELEGSFIPRQDDKVLYVRIHDGAEGFTEQAFLDFIHGTATTEEIPAG